MPAHALPSINALVDVSSADGTCYPSRVEDVTGDRYRIAVPLDVPETDRPAVGAGLELAWLSDASRLVVPVRLVSVATPGPARPQCWVVQVAGEPRRQTRRAYVRGGGGELIRLRRRGVPAPVHGRVIDLGEGGVRCRVPAGDFRCDERVEIAVKLGRTAFEAVARVLAVRPDPENGQDELVFSYETTEAVGRIIRGYVLKLQMQERRRMVTGA